MMSVIDPKNYISYGGDYRIPMYYGLLSESFVNQLRNAGTYDDASFSREFLSKWTSSVEGSLFEFEKLNKMRRLKKAEWKARRNEKDNVFYVASVDVARHSARTIVEIFKVKIGEDFFKKSIVNVIPMEGRNFHYQAQQLKRLDDAFDFDTVVVDGNGLGVGLIDFLMVPTVDDETGLTFPAWNVQNVDKYKDFARDQKVGAPFKIHIIKTNQHSAGDIHSHAYNELFSNKVSLLIDDKEAKQILMEKVKGGKMSPQERIRFLEPYKWTSMLVAETSNLKINRTSTSLKLEMIRTDSEKDTFSAMEYGLWVIGLKEKDYYAKLRRKSRRMSSYMFFD